MFNADFDRISAELLDFQQVEDDLFSVIESFTGDVQRIIRRDIGQCRVSRVCYGVVLVLGEGVGGSTTLPWG